MVNVATTDRKILIEDVDSVLVGTIVELPERVPSSISGLTCIIVSRKCLLNDMLKNRNSQKKE